MAESEQKKLRIGWFSFSCCEDSTIVLTELMNDNYMAWKKLLDIRHARVLQSRNVLDQMDVAFIEGAMATETHENMVKKIRDKAAWVVAIGACACTGMPSSQRNYFDEKTTTEISPILQAFNYNEKAKKLEDVVKVDAKVNGCPMDTKVFAEVLQKALTHFGVA